MLPRVVSVLLCGLVLASATSAHSDGKYTAAFLNIGAGARAAGMGGSFGALGLDATTIFWNPAAMGRLARPEIVLMHSTQFSNLLNYDTGHFVWPNTVEGSFGLGFMRLATGDIYFTENLPYYDWGADNLPGTGDPGEGDRKHNPGERVIYDPSRLRIVNDSEQALFLSYARQLNSRLAVGGNIKLIWQSVGQYSSSGWGFDLGAIYDLTPRLTAALSLQDVSGTKVHWSTRHNDTRTINLRPGLAYSLPLPSLSSHINLASDVDIRFDHIKENTDFHFGAASFDLHFGLEYWLHQTIALRVGSERKSLTAGAGIKISFFEVDYAFTGFELGSSHRISLTLHRPRFGKKGAKPSKRLPVPKPVAPKPPAEIEEQPAMEAEKPTEPLRRPEREEPRATEKLPVLEQKLVGSIKFEIGSADLRPPSIPALAAIAKELKEYPHQRIKIVGHTDNRRIQTPEFPNNQALSLARAKVVRDFLVETGGIESERILVEGRGASQPVASNDTVAGRSMNRRAEIFLTAKRY